MATKADPPKKVRLACRRCRTRRIKCDGQVPACSNCSKVGVVCLDVDSQNSDLLIPRNFVNAARARILWLQEIIRERLPDVDLSAGPCVEVTPDPRGDAREAAAAAAAAREQDDVASTTAPPSVQSSETRVDTQPPPRPVKRPYQEHASSGEHDETFSEQAHSVAMNLGMLYLNSDSAQKHYIGSSSGLLFTHLIGASPSSNDSPAATAEEPPSSSVWQPSGASVASLRNRYQNLHHFLRQELPKKADAEVLLQTYIRWVHPDFPALDPASLCSALETIYASTSCPLEDDPLIGGWPCSLEGLYWNGRQYSFQDASLGTIPLPVVAFILFMVFSIGAIVKVRSRTFDYPPEKFHQAALYFSPDCFTRIMPDTIQALVTIIVHGIMTPTAINLWTLTHVGVAHCIELGLHREQSTADSENPAHRQAMRFIFYTLYSLDRSISSIQGRPLGFRDEAFDVKVPSPISLPNCVLNATPPLFVEAVTHYAALQFELDQIVSDIKMYLYHLPLTRARFPWPADPVAQQGKLHKKLLEWRAKAEKLGLDRYGLDRRQQQMWHLKLKIRVHKTMILLFQPSQMIRKPSSQALQVCFDNACRILQDYQALHDHHGLYHDWRSVQDVFAAGATLIYSFWTSIDVRQHASAVEVSRSLRSCSTLLSIGGEWWPSAKRGYNSFGSIADLTIQRVYAEGVSSKQMRASLPQDSAQARVDLDQQLQAGNSLARLQSGLDTIPFEYSPSSVGPTTTTTDLSSSPPPPPPQQQQHSEIWSGMRPELGGQDAAEPFEFASEIEDFLSRFDRADLSWNLPLNNMQDPSNQQNSLFSDFLGPEQF